MDATLLARLHSFYGEPPAEKKLILKLVLEAANANPTTFIQLVHQQKFETAADELANNLPVFYESLAADLDNWADFLIEEARRLFTIAYTAKAPHKVLNHLNELCFINKDKLKNRGELLAILSKELTSDHVAFRYYAASLLPDFIKSTDFEAVNKLRQLLHDPNWRIRYSVYQNLKDLSLLEERDTLSLADRLRAQLWNPYSLD